MFFSFLQVSFLPSNTIFSDAWNFVYDPGLLPFIFLILYFVFAVLILFAIRALLRRRMNLLQAFHTSVLLIRVPKELKKEDMNAEKSQQQIQEMIGHMETVFATIGSLKASKGVLAWFLGRADTFCFEIVAHKDKISFYAAVPKKFRTFMEEQIHAQYPNAEIEEAPDYNIFSPTGIVLGSYVTFRRQNFFPIRTYRKLETDSLNSLTNALAKVESGDGAAIQYTVRSARSSWRKEGLRIAKAMQQGKKLSQVSRGDILSGVGSELKSIAAAAKPKDPNKPVTEPYRLSPLEEEMVKGLEEKAAKAGLNVNIRIVVSAQNPAKAQQYLNDILNAYGQFNIYEYGNSFKKKMPYFQSALIRSFIYRQFSHAHQTILNAEEAASVYHFPLPVTDTPKINWLLSRKALPPSNLPNEGLVLGYADYRGHRYDVRIKSADRRRHMYVIGKSGTGKTEFLKGMVQQDIEQGRGVCIIDPHGDLADEALTFVPKERAEDVIFFDPSDFERPIGLNMLEFDPRYPQLRTFVINEMLKIFDKLYDLKATGGPMFETYMRNAILLLMDDPESGQTLMDIPRVLADEDYRNYKLSKCTSAEVKDFWTKEALKAGGEASLQNMVPYITSKLASFIYNDYMRPIVGQQKSAFNLFDAMNEQKIIILKLPKGQIGDLNAYLLGMIMIGKILDAALKRGEMPPEERKDFFLYVDEFQNFLTDSITSILSEARKYGLCLVMAHQFIGQLTIGAGKDTTIRDAIFGNVGTMLIGRIGMEDAEFLAKEFVPVFTEFDLVNAEAYTFNIKLLIDNQASRPFNIHPVRPRHAASSELANMVRELSRYKYGRKRELVESEMTERRAVALEQEDEEEDWFDPEPVKKDRDESENEIEEESEHPDRVFENEEPESGKAEPPEDQLDQRVTQE
ncbi:MAG TPA: type IV secretion system DNA-binding domain-containing protein [Patescibacteria group bacterium]|nr:type IV secretion system DNA-binding domain-containing protein [Patescibacteria group bacterium]